jgi:hypothetical protein
MVRRSESASATKRLFADGKADFTSAVSAASQQTEFLSSGLAATEPQFKAITIATTSSQIQTDANRTVLAQVLNTLFADRISRAQAAVTAGVAAGHRADSTPKIDAAGLGLTAVLIGGLWAAQASEAKRPTWQFLLDHLLDRSN